MKNIIMFCGLLLMAGIAAAQQPVQFYAHEDHVKPSMNAAYVNFLKTAKATYEKNQVNLSYNTFFQEDFTYYFFLQMQPMDIGAVYKSLGEAEAKVGKETFANLLSEKAKCIESHREFITAFLPQYSHLAPAAGENYRRMMFWVPMEGMEAEVEAISKGWVELHRSKNAPRGYQTFKTVFGGDAGYVFVFWGKDQIDFFTKSQKNNELFGEEGSKLWSRTMAITQKIYYKNAWFRPELSYSYKAPVVAK